MYPESPECPVVELDGLHLKRRLVITLYVFAFSPTVSQMLESIRGRSLAGFADDV